MRDQDREFFIAYAQTQRRTISDAALRTQVATSDHAPEDYRADTVRNIDAWYDAFDVRPGQRLYLPALGARPGLVKSTPGAASTPPRRSVHRLAGKHVLSQSVLESPLGASALLSVLNERTG